MNSKNKPNWHGSDFFQQILAPKILALSVLYLLEIIVIFWRTAKNISTIIVSSNPPSRRRNLRTIREGPI